jgi:hypothetical protein
MSPKRAAPPVRVKVVIVPEHFTYFSDIEEHFGRRRGNLLLLSTLDWALIETWKDAGIPLEAVLRGIDAAFDRYDARPSKTRKVNSLAYCAQEVLAAAEEMKEAALGASREPAADAGFEPAQIAAYFARNAAQLDTATAGVPATARALVEQSAATLRQLATGLAQATGTPLEDLERRLTVVEEKLMAALLAATPDEQLVAVRAEADRELAPHRRKMSAAQIDQLLKQYLHKRLLERYGLPRLSLFYM